MRKQVVNITSIKQITHDVLQIVTERPSNFNFLPGQATEISVNKNGWKAEKRPFTFTSLPGDEFLEFTIKIYPSHKGVTNKLLDLKENDELILHEVFGEIRYKGEGVFIAGGAGVTPFISILRYLKSRNEIGDNKLIFANNTKADIILAREFMELLGDNFINILSHDIIVGYEHGFITKEFLEKHIIGLDKNVYLCGPPPMMNAVEKLLSNKGFDEKLVIKEAF
jgi:ferredoxin-NADP reductase